HYKTLVYETDLSSFHHHPAAARYSSVPLSATLEPISPPVRPSARTPPLPVTARLGQIRRDPCFPLVAPIKAILDFDPRTRRSVPTSATAATSSSIGPNSPRPPLSPYSEPIFQARQAIESLEDGNDIAETLAHTEFE
ncbi:hypothetical protein FRC01_005296, partial [Tulasnella sp. 417]